MKTDLDNEVFAIVEAKVRSTPSPIEFEFAYQVRVAIDCIRFAIHHVEKFAKPCDQMREAGLQLLDALDRLHAVDRRFQVRSQMRRETTDGTRSADLNGSHTDHGTAAQ